MRKSTKDQQLPMELVIFSLQINSKISRGPWLQAFVRISTIWSSWHSNIYTAGEKEMRNFVPLQPHLFNKIKCPNSLMHETPPSCTCAWNGCTTHRFLRTRFWEESESSLTLTQCEADIRLWKHPQSFGACITAGNSFHLLHVASNDSSESPPADRSYPTINYVLDGIRNRIRVFLSTTHIQRQSQWLITSKLYWSQLNLSSCKMRSTVAVRPLEIPAASCQVEFYRNWSSRSHLRIRHVDETISMVPYIDLCKKLASSYLQTLFTCCNPATTTLNRWDDGLRLHYSRRE